MTISSRGVNQITHNPSELMYSLFLMGMTAAALTDSGNIIGEKAVTMASWLNRENAAFVTVKAYLRSLFFNNIAHVCEGGCVRVVTRNSVRGASWRPYVYHQTRSPGRGNHLAARLYVMSAPAISISSSMWGVRGVRILILRRHYLIIGARRSRQYHAAWW